MIDKEEQQPFAATRIRDLSDDDRPREKALASGIRSLSDAELIALIFGGGLPGMSVIDLARSILRDCDNKLNYVAQLSMEELMAKYRGVGKAKAVCLAAAFELGRRNREQKESRRDVVIRSSADVVTLMRHKLEDLEYEEFWVIMLSRSNAVKYVRCISQGGTAATMVDVKLLLKRAIDCLAEGIILVHNHPSGNNSPSPEDCRLTNNIKEAAKLLQIKVLDHVIIAGDKSYSFADEGKI